MWHNGAGLSIEGDWLRVEKNRNWLGVGACRQMYVGQPLISRHGRVSSKNSHYQCPIDSPNGCEEAYAMP